jgi:hypothetical protein
MDLLSFPTDRFASVNLEWKSSIIYVVGVLFLVNFIVRHVISYRRLRAFRGPFWASVTQLWLFQKTAKGIVNTEMRKVTEKYGKYFVSFCEALETAIDRMLVIRDLTTSD